MCWMLSILGSAVLAHPQSKSAAKVLLATGRNLQHLNYSCPDTFQVDWIHIEGRMEHSHLCFLWVTCTYFKRSGIFNLTNCLLSSIIPHDSYKQNIFCHKCLSMYICTLVGLAGSLVLKIFWIKQKDIELLKQLFPLTKYWKIFL